MAAKRKQDRPDELARAIAAGDFAAAKRLLARRSAAVGARRRAEPEAPPTAEAARGPTDAKVMSLGEACGGAEAAATVGGRRVSYHAAGGSLDHWLGDAAAVEHEVLAVLRGARQRMDELAASPALCHAANAAPEDILLVSPWQWGLSDPVLFMIGMMFCEGGRLVVEYAIARDEREEGAICQAFADRHARAGVLVTFSGKRSHRKHLALRCALHGVALSAEAWDAPASRIGAPLPAHLDLRKECRTRWAGRFTRCTLGVLERRLLGRARQGLTPRSACHEAYRDFVAGGNAAAMRDVQAHCAADLATMAQLVCVLLTGCEGGSP